jgi:peptidoglycan glycosyltransferase
MKRPHRLPHPENVGRRDYIAALLSATRWSTKDKSASEPAASAAALLDIRTRRLLKIENPDAVQRWSAAPGSTLKPFTLLALLESGKLTAHDQLLCPRYLTVAGHQLNCSHPDVPLPMNVSRALAYSCNCAVVHFARRLSPGELEASLQRMGLADHLTPYQPLLLALGEAGISVTPLDLLFAYRRLALRVPDPRFAHVLEGLEGAVDFGTAQAVRLEGIRVAGKTGTVRLASGLHAAWFAGFAPSRVPEVAVVVLSQGLSGGADSAPQAADLLRSYFARRS